jgi:retron-type reverse transcriptase
VISYTNLFPQVTSWENLLLAAQKARRGKSRRPNVARFDLDRETELAELRAELLSGAYRPGAYRTFHIYEPKPRLISAAPYRDRVVHHALCNVIEPLFERRFIADSYANRVGKGTHAGLNRYAEYVRRYRYVLRCDIAKYFPSIDHEILFANLCRVIRCPDTRVLIRRIINASNPQEPVTQHFPGDDLFTPAERRHGLPIGNQTSQFFANVYLDPLDHFVKEGLRLPYLRYVDDFAAFSDNKEQLCDARTRMAAFLVGLRLRLHPLKTRLFRTGDGTCFVGYRVFPDRLRLPRSNLTRLNARMRRYRALYAAGAISTADLRQRVCSWLGHARHANANRLIGKLFQEHVFIHSEN